MPDSMKPLAPPAELKRGTLLKYKKRIFKSNWRETQVSLFSNATIVTQSAGQRGRETIIPMANQTTLIIFGKELKAVPKKPLLPPGYRIEQLLAVGLIHSTSQKAVDNGRERMAIIFHWFLPLSIHDLFDWIIAINNSIPTDKQILADEDLTMSLVMAGAVHYNQMMMLHSSHPANASTSSGPQNQDWNQGTDSGHLNAINYSSLDAESSDNYLDDAGAADLGFDWGAEFDDCSAFTAMDAFAVF